MMCGNQADEERKKQDRRRIKITNESHARGTGGRGGAGRGGRERERERERERGKRKRARVKERSRVFFVLLYIFVSPWSVWGGGGGDGWRGFQSSHFVMYQRGKKEEKCARIKTVSLSLSLFLPHSRTLLLPVLPFQVPPFKQNKKKQSQSRKRNTHCGLKKILKQKKQKKPAGRTWGGGVWVGGDEDVVMPHAFGWCAFGSCGGWWR